VEQVRRLRVGDGLDPATDVGPLISETQQSKVLDYVHLGIREGAEVLTGGDALEDGGYEEGYFVAPTVFGSVQPGMRIMQEEIFGPVVAVVGARDTAHAIEIANNVPFGLTASLVTRDLSTALQYVDMIAAGVVHVNRESTALDFYAPFGGMKASSSHSRELGKAARDYFTETKTVYLQGLSDD
jgi:aldehyde dehydrogenase (NAD+)